ncbi:hypothetical protein AgCh_014219 [Apium graveolens]
MRKGFEKKKGKVGIMQICLCGVGLLDCRASGRLGCVRVLSDPDRRNVLDPGYLDGGDVATCPGLLKVNTECVRVLSDPDRRNVLDPENLDGGDAATCPGILCLGPGSLQLGLTYYGLSMCVCLWVIKKKKKKKKRIKEITRLSFETFGGNGNGDEDLELPLFDITTLTTATNGFSKNCMLGEGGFGPVYKGLHDEGKEIAVKRLSKDSRQGLGEFKNEVSCIAQLQHRNLVKLLGCSVQEGERIPVYEYMPNRSLDLYIFDKKQSDKLGWPLRYNIINGIARGLLYLHQDSRLRIIHRDLKASNVLLDLEMNPKISDFGTARICGETETGASTTRVVGTYGYMSPEYATDGIFSVKSDVYSFGVLLLEIVSGKRNKNFTHLDHNLNLLGHAWRTYTDGNVLDLLDEVIEKSSHIHQFEVFRAIQIGLLCVQQYPADRPTMATVVLMLTSEIPLPQPKQPGFFIERKLHEGDSSSSSSNYCSVTTIAPR